MPSMRDTVFSSMPGTNLSLASNSNIKAAKMPNGMSRRCVVRSMAKGRMVADTPRISSMLAMLLPTTLPMATSPLPLRAEEMPTNSSGDDVPIPTMVRPMMKLDILARWAIATDESTNRSADSSNSPKPMTRNK